MSMPVKRLTIRLVIGLLAVIPLAILAGCGGSSSSSSSSSSSTAAGETTGGESGGGEASGGAHSAVVEAAEAEYAKYTKPQPPIEIPSLPKRPPTGKKITVVSCQLPVCKEAMEPAKKAAEELGWNVTYLQTELTPEAYQATMNQIVADPPELLTIIASIPFEVIEKQIKELAAMKIPIALVAPIGVEPNPAGPVQGITVGPLQFGQTGRLMGDAVVNDAGEGAKTVWITDPSLDALWGPMEKEFSKVVEGSGGSVDGLSVEVAEIGKSIPTQVVSYVQAHPEVEYLAFALNDLSVGVTQALESAGLNESVKTVAQQPQPTNLEAIKNGTEWTGVAAENSTIGYRSVDQLARVLEGVELGELANPTGWAQIFNAENVTETKTVPVTPGTPDVFLRAWHLK